MRRSHRWGLLTCIVAISTLTASSFAQRIEWAKQLTVDTGWVATRRDLFWTTSDGREWKNITPPQRARDKQISAVFFLDASRGWVVLSRDADDDQVPVRFWLVSTDDGGANWSSRPIVPRDWVNLSEGVHLNISPEGAYVYFWDAAEGILNLPGAASLLTSDGGKTWRETMGEADPVVFASRNDGWELDDGARSPRSGSLFVTHDGSRSWQQVILPGPKPGEANSTYSLPIFTDKDHGFLTVEYSGAEIHTVALFSSTNGGHTWKQDKVLPFDPHAAFTAVNSEWKALRFADNRLSLGVPSATSSPSGGGAVDAEINGVKSLNFVDSLHGWALAWAGSRCDSRIVGCIQLLSTPDSGATWANITPAPIKGRIVGAKPGIRTGPLIWKKPPQKALSEQQQAVLGTAVPQAVLSDVSIHLGFDISYVMTIPQMQTWWDTSPFWDTNVYLPGSANRGVDSNLNAAWTSGIQKQGWGIIPTWFGAQPSTACAPGKVQTPGSCSNYFATVIPSTASAASTKGVAEANAAIHSLTAPGPTGINLKGTIIYKNIENYVTGTNGDSTAVQAFLSGWSNTLHAAGYLAGVYGNPSPASTDFAKVTPVLDDAWIAKTSPHAASTWGIWTLGGTTDKKLWIKHQRIHQFWNDHSATYGGVSPAPPGNIDSDIEDATIIVTPDGIPRKAPSWTWTKFSSPVSTGFGYFVEPFDINDSDQIVGGYLVPPNADPYGIRYDEPTGKATYPINYGSKSAIYATDNLGNMFGQGDSYWTRSSAGTFAPFSFPAGTTAFPPSAYSLSGVGFGLNDVGQMSGTLCCDANNHYYGFLYEAGQFTNLSYPDVAGTYSTFAGGLNGQEKTVGYYSDGHAYHGFTYSAADGWTTLDYPGAANTYLLKINSNNEILGTTAFPSGGAPSSNYFLFSDGAWANIALPFYPSETPYLVSVNDFDDLVGQGYYFVGTEYFYVGIFGRTQGRN